ncbi:MAG TPA: putative DNA-binding domain-containing protein, partial [Polyangiaceae bacterium]
MTPEANVQARLAELLLRRRDLTKDPEAQAFAREHVAGNARVSPVEQLEIYREQYWLRHTGSLVEDFPGLGGILAQSDWERLVEEYLVAHPP